MLNRKKSPAGAAAEFRALLAQDDIVVMPGAYDPFSARLIERAGFQAIFMTGGGVSRNFCLPDVGLLTMTEMVTQLRNIVNAVSLPVIADADTGYGNAVNVMRTVPEFEATGAAGLFLEDQETPKKCGKYQGVQLIPAKEMSRKIEGAVRSRWNPDFLLIGRIMQTQVEGEDGILARGRAYVEAGADVIMIRGLRTLEEHKMVARAFKVPVMLTFPEVQTKGFELGPLPGIRTVADLQQIGFKGVIFPSEAHRAAIRGMQEVLACIKKDGSAAGCQNLMVSFKEREEIIGQEEVQNIEKELVHFE